MVLPAVLAAGGPGESLGRGAVTVNEARRRLLEIRSTASKRRDARDLVLVTLGIVIDEA